jgi:hypothetical protein
MSSALLNLLNKARGEVAAKRGNNVDTTRLKDGDNYLRLFPNKENAEGIFYQPFGMHYVKYQNEEGKEVATAYVCDQHTHGRACQLCEMVLEGKARHKGNKAMEDKISQMRSTPRYMVNGMLSAREDFTDVEKTQLIELPATVFDDICKVMAEDLSDEIGNPLSKSEGYAFCITRTGSGRDTKYSVSPKRKVFKGDIPDKFWNSQHDLIAFANQADETKLLATSRIMGRQIGIAAPTSIAASTSPTAGASLASLPGFGSVTGHETVSTVGSAAVAIASTPAPESIVDEEILRAAEAEFRPAETVTTAVTPEPTEMKATEATPAVDPATDALLKELEGLGGL